MGSKRPQIQQVAFAATPPQKHLHKAGHEQDRLTLKPDTWLLIQPSLCLDLSEQRDYHTAGEGANVYAGTMAAS